MPFNAPVTPPPPPSIPPSPPPPSGPPPSPPPPIFPISSGQGLSTLASLGISLGALALAAGAAALAFFLLYARHRLIKVQKSKSAKFLASQRNLAAGGGGGGCTPREYTQNAPDAKALSKQSKSALLEKGSRGSLQKGKSSAGSSLANASLSSIGPPACAPAASGSSFLLSPRANAPASDALYSTAM